MVQVISDSWVNGFHFSGIPVSNYVLTRFANYLSNLHVFRIITGAWYIYPSGGGAPYGFGWGGDPTDKRVPGDYDGDGKTDIAIYRTGTGTWLQLLFCQAPLSQLTYLSQSSKLFFELRRECSNLRIIRTKGWGLFFRSGCIPFSFFHKMRFINSACFIP